MPSSWLDFLRGLCKESFLPCTIYFPSTCQQQTSKIQSVSSNIQQNYCSPNPRHPLYRTPHISPYSASTTRSSSPALPPPEHKPKFQYQLRSRLAISKFSFQWRRRLLPIGMDWQSRIIRRFVLMIADYIYDRSMRVYRSGQIRSTFP